MHDHYETDRDSLEHQGDEQYHEEEDEEAPGFLDADDVAEEVYDDEDCMDQGDGADEDEGEEGEDEEGYVDDSEGAFMQHGEPIYATAFHPTHPFLVLTGGGDDKSYLWRADTGDVLAQLPQHEDSVAAVAFSRDGMYAASGALDGKVHVVEVAVSADGTVGEVGAAGERRGVVSLDAGSGITWLDWHPRGHVLLAGTEDGTLWMWQVPSGNCMNVFSGHVESVTCGQWAPDGKSIVSGSSDGSLILWDPKAATATLRLTASDARFHSVGITSLAMHPDGQLLLTGAEDGTARLIHGGNGRILASFDSHTESIEAAAFCPTMPIVATGSVDGNICLWDTQAMRLRQTLRHDDAITSLKFHKTQPLIYSVSTDRTARVWDARTGDCLRVLRGHREGILSFDYNVDGSVIVTGADDGSARVWGLQ
ncbi:quinon protein alcohol dehydrogenase-like superfamily [Fimicolochytrium jonesii]|uniref:quinon protein alcohol dehydrogenase-like superfamily n=1 Tax=Fimicolochytrium jonesii TaxID=1396493 RepID=UPI0022FDF4B0|nr:quinon protein alcohol dehydrogenase-like superfamily [Fimicolochytrium jonesii]KAI8815607.1 quinon protein alcohol dehydrogenase-like superfamily [Fimicolochytrium jonesii]